MSVPVPRNCWLAYFAGFALTLALKAGKAVYLGKKQGRKTKDILLEWLFEPSLENASSWTATVGGVWVIGSIYINDIVDIVGLKDLPLDYGISFFLGTLFEVIVPNITKWIVSHIPTSRS